MISSSEYEMIETHEKLIAAWKRYSFQSSNDRSDFLALILQLRKVNLLIVETLRQKLLSLKKASSIEVSRLSFVLLKICTSLNWVSTSRKRKTFNKLIGLDTYLNPFFSLHRIDGVSAILRFEHSFCRDKHAPLTFNVPKSLLLSREESDLCLSLNTFLSTILAENHHINRQTTAFMNGSNVKTKSPPKAVTTLPPLDMSTSSPSSSSSSSSCHKTNTEDIFPRSASRPLLTHPVLPFFREWRAFTLKSLRFEKLRSKCLRQITLFLFLRWKAFVERYVCIWSLRLSAALLMLVFAF